MIIGLVGKPSAGKSTFFKAATLAEVDIAPYPFTTIKPNHGVGYVRIDCIDKELNTQCQPNHGFCIQHQRFVPIDLVDVAGLVPGASEGKGLGNKFLDDLRQADAFIHIVDVSGTTNSEGKIVTEGNHNPCDDVLFLEEELNKWYFNLLVKAWKSFSRKVELEESDFADSVSKQFSGLKVTKRQVKDVLGKLSFSERPSIWNDSQLMKFALELRNESKPTIIAANKIDMEKSKENLEKIKTKFPHAKIIPCSADFELALREAAKAGLIEYIPGDSDFKIIGELNAGQKKAIEKIKDFLKIHGNTGVQQILNFSVFSLLGYLAIFPAGATKLADSKGRILPDCFLLPGGSTALDFAYYLHTDFGKNFIRAIDARTKKALGKSYELKNRDALEIVTK
jgi:ribosome-binding ATPase